MGDEEKVQSLIAELKILESYFNEANTRQAMITNAIIESSAAQEALQGLLKENSEVLVPIGGGLYIYSQAQRPDKLLVNIGANVVVEKTKEDALSFLDIRMKDLEKAQETLESQKNEFKNRINVINNTVRGIIEKQQKG